MMSTEPTLYEPKKGEFSVSIEYPVFDTQTSEVFISAAIIFTYDIEGSFIGHQFIKDEDVEIVPLDGYDVSRDPKLNSNIN